MDISYFINYSSVDDSEISPYIMEDMINSTIEGLRPSIPEPLEIDQLDINFGDFIGESLIRSNILFCILKSSF
jgi:hypothetical protein